MHRLYCRVQTHSPLMRRQRFDDHQSANSSTETPLGHQQVTISKRRFIAVTRHVVPMDPGNGSNGSLVGMLLWHRLSICGDRHYLSGTPDVRLSVLQSQCQISHWGSLNDNLLLYDNLAGTGSCSVSG